MRSCGWRVNVNMLATADILASSPRGANRSLKVCMTNVIGSTGLPLMIPPCRSAAGGMSLANAWASPCSTEHIAAACCGEGNGDRIVQFKTSRHQCRNEVLLSGPQDGGITLAVFAGTMEQNASMKNMKSITWCARVVLTSVMRLFEGLGSAVMGEVSPCDLASTMPFCIKSTTIPTRNIQAVHVDEAGLAARGCAG